MNIKSVTNGRTQKIVTLMGVTTETNDEIREAAYAATGESRESTFGTNIIRPVDSGAVAQGIVVVNIYTD